LKKASATFTDLVRESKKSITKIQHSRKLARSMPESIGLTNAIINHTERGYYGRGNII